IRIYRPIMPKRNGQIKEISYPALSIHILGARTKVPKRLVWKNIYGEKAKRREGKFAHSGWLVVPIQSLHCDQLETILVTVRNPDNLMVHWFTRPGSGTASPRNRGAGRASSPAIMSCSKQDLMAA
ncbi:MAG: hypothetical protein NTY64_06110, partial [Deltaproteobacteria bacterium]|nr:hypothetical protein [Deltaproteobacteria bacterium]